MIEFFGGGRKHFFGDVSEVPAFLKASSQRLKVSLDVD